MAGTWIEDGRNARALPTLVNTCQRVLSTNIDSIAGFGDHIPFRLIRPILQGCNADTLLRLERETPRLQERTSELWREICVRYCPIEVEEILNSNREEPESWRDEFLSKREREAKRLEEVASRLRNQRIEAEELKRKRQVKYTDQLPPPKRPRLGCPATPKTLFAKTRKEATKIQKNVFGSRILPPPPGNSKGFRSKPDTPVIKMTQKVGSSPVINKIAVRAPCLDSPLLPSQTSRKLEIVSKPSESKPLGGRPQSSSVLPARSGITRKSSSETISGKDPTSTLPIPRQRAPSQVLGVTSLSSTFTPR